MVLKKRLPILLAVFIIWGSITTYASDINPTISYEQQIDTLADTPINPMGLPDIDPITNPASDNWLTQYIAYDGNVKDLTQEDFNRITRFDMSDKFLEFIPKEIGNLYNVTFISLGSNYISDIPKEIGNLSKLRNLDLSYNKVDTISKEIGNLSNLEILRLRYNPLVSLPPEIGNLYNLKSLDLYMNLLVSLPPEIGNLSNLEKLNLDYSKLVSLPPEIGNLSNLVELTLYMGGLKSLPPEIGNLLNLKSLGLEKNSLYAIPKEFENLSNLLDLKLANQSIKLPTEYVLVNNLTINNPVSFLGTPIIPKGISGGIYNYDNNSISWELYGGDKSESFSFSQEVTIGKATTTFYGSVTQPIIWGEKPQVDKTITSFELLSENISTQNVANGTPLNALSFPTTLEVIADGNNETITGITWACDKAYEPSIAGEYIFSSSMPANNGYVILDGIQIPTIKVIIAPYTIKQFNQTIISAQTILNKPNTVAKELVDEISDLADAFKKYNNN